MTDSPPASAAAAALRPGRDWEKMRAMTRPRKINDLHSTHSCKPLICKGIANAC